MLQVCGNSRIFAAKKNRLPIWWRKKKEQMKVSELRQDERNFRKHSKRNREMIKKSVDECGLGRSVVVDRDGVLIAGNGLASVIDKNTPIRMIETDGSELVVVKRTDIGTDDEKRKKLAMADNATGDNVEWDTEQLRGALDDDTLRAFDIELPDVGVDIDELIEHASSIDATREYSTDTNYDLGKLYRERVNDDISRKIDEGVQNGQIRAEIADVLRTRAQQCSVFNFDELCKYYRSADATDVERELLRRLYLVFVAPKELFDAQVLKFNEVSEEIYDDELTRKTQTD